jgi:hypothetical protein
VFGERNFTEFFYVFLPVFRRVNSCRSARGTQWFVARMITPRKIRFTFSSVAALALSTPRLIHAESSVAYKYADYRESGGRVAVETQSALLASDVGTDWHAKVSGTLDAIAGATPNGQPAPAGSTEVPLSTLHDRRKAWTADVARQFSRANFALGFGNSRESDYVSNGWSLNVLTDFNRKNTTLLTGIAGTDDDVKIYSQTEPAKKRSNDFIIGVTQLLDRRTTATVNFSWGRSSGYLSDPYKVVQKDIEVLPELFLTQTFRENRPTERSKGIALFALNHSYPELRGAVDASYRFYRDTFGTAAHTLDFAWLQRLGGAVIVAPGVRLYRQSAADFYHYDLNDTAITPRFVPREGDPNYSSDYRLSEMTTSNLTLKLIWTAASWLQLDAALEHYVMNGRDGVTPQSAYARATTVTFGVRLAR